MGLDLTALVHGLTSDPRSLLLVFLVLAFVPGPTELTLPAAGGLVAASALPFWLPVAAGTLSGLVYSVLGFALGRFGCRRLAHRVGIGLGVNVRSLDSADRLIAKFGLPGIVIARVLPAIRNAAPLVAGLCDMDIWVLAFGTAVGSALWSLLLVLFGMGLLNSWTAIAPRLQQYPVMSCMAAVGMLALALVVWRPLRLWHASRN